MGVSTYNSKSNKASKVRLNGKRIFFKNFLPSLESMGLIILLAFIHISCGPKHELPTPDPDNGGLILPKGFRALVVADSVGPTRHIAVSPEGFIYAKLRITTAEPGNLALRDTTGDGRVDMVVPFGDYPNDGTFATEMRIHNGYLYYSSEQVVYRQKLIPGKLLPEGKPEAIMTDHHPRQWHNAKSLAFDDQDGMYVTFSAPTNVCEDWTNHISNSSAHIPGEYPCTQLYDQAGIWKFNAKKPGQKQSDGKRFATGLRSVVGITWSKEDGQLYAVQHGRDYLYAHAPHLYTPWQNAILPAEEFVRIKEGDDFGWPYTYYDPFKKRRIVAPEYGGDGDRSPEGMTLASPLMGFPAHWAPNDLLFYQGDLFPEHYKNGAFVAFHGSTNRSPYPQGGYVVAFVPFENGQPSGNWEVFADGFVGTDTVADMSQAKYRPMGIAEGPDGSLYISESKNGKIWRITFDGDKNDFGDIELNEMERLKNKPHLKLLSEQEDNLSLRGAQDGKELYAIYCTACHQDNGLGEGEHYPPLAGSEWVIGPKDRLIKSVVNGLNEEIRVKGKTYNTIMPAFNFLSDEQVAAILNYVRSEYGKTEGGIREEEIRRLRERE